MSGNAKQRRQERHHRELVELGRRAKDELDAHAGEVGALREQHAAELARLRAGHERDLAELQKKYDGEIAWWARSASDDADRLAEREVALQKEQARAGALQDEIDELKRGGLITMRRHEELVDEATARLRERLRRANEERLAPKTVVLEQVANRGTR